MLPSSDVYQRHHKISTFLLVFCLITQLLLLQQFATARNTNSIICSTSTTTAEPPFMEYFMEHQVTEKEARLAIKEMPESEFSKKAMPFCDVCTEKIRNYCLGPIFLRDHCCCELRHEQGKRHLAGFCSVYY